MYILYLAKASSGLSISPKIVKGKSCTMIAFFAFFVKVPFDGLRDCSRFVGARAGN